MIVTAYLPYWMGESSMVMVFILNKYIITARFSEGH